MIEAETGGGDQWITPKKKKQLGLCPSARGCGGPQGRMKLSDTGPIRWTAWKEETGELWGRGAGGGWRTELHIALSRAHDHAIAGPRSPGLFLRGVC